MKEKAKIVAEGGQYIFAEKMYHHPHFPYYNSYKGHTFRIDHFLNDPGEDDNDLVYLVCDSNVNVVIHGYVHYHDLVKL